MQSVSQEWKENQKQPLANENFVEITLSIADPNALADIVASDNGAVYFANTTQIVSEVERFPIKYATLEQDIWALDGSVELLPENNFGDNGYIGSALSGHDCAFEKIPTVTLRFTKPYTLLIPGITIEWGVAYGEYPTEFCVKIYNSGTVIASKTVMDNSSVLTEIKMDIANYDKITIEILKWCLPYHRARISDAFVGLKQKYVKSQLMNFEHNQKADPISASLPKNEIKFGIDNSSGEYDPNNPKGLTKYLIISQEAKVKYGTKLGDKIEWISGGVFYLSEWEAPQNGITANFTARDLLEFLNDVYIEGAINEQGVSLYSLAEKVLVSANLPLCRDGKPRWVLSDTLKDIKITAPLPMVSKAQCLQLIANAACCVLYPDRQGVLHIEPLVTAKTDYAINDLNSYNKSEMSLTKVLKQVDARTYSYMVGTLNKEIFSGMIAGHGEQTVVITYSAMATKVHATAEDGEIVSAEYFAQACRMKIRTNGSMKITIIGDLVVSSTSTISITNEPSGEIQKMENPLITTSEHAAIVGEWARGYMENRKTLKSQWRADPRVDMLDIVSNANEYVENSVCLTDIKFKYNGAFRGECEGRII